WAKGYLPILFSVTFTCTCRFSTCILMSSSILGQFINTIIWKNISYFSHITYFHNN
ncbi:hypothetical protein ACJX0J_036357, partial [Zea mays]